MVTKAVRLTPSDRPPLSGFDRIMYGVWSLPGPSWSWETTLYLITGRRQRTALRSAGRFVTLDHGGWKVRYDLSNAGDFGQYWRAVREGGFEPGTTALLRELLGSGSRFVDLGANIGYYTAEAIGLVGPSGRIWSFEPNPPAFERLRGNIELNQGRNVVHAYMVAASDIAGRRPLYRFGDADTLASLVKPSEQSVDVELVPVDSFLANERVDLVKVDVEGGELPALRGLATTLQQNLDLALIVEWNRRYRTEALWQFLAERFKVYRIRNRPKGYQLTRLSTYDDAKRLPLVNLLCASS
jgi:FkbM family methyltransferase